MSDNIEDLDNEWSRSNALRSAIEFFEKVSTRPAADADAVVEVAEKFFKFIKEK